jgi:hypothetical protein
MPAVKKLADDLLTQPVEDPPAPLMAYCASGLGFVRLLCVYCSSSFAYSAGKGGVRQTTP